MYLLPAGTRPRSQIKFSGLAALRLGLGQDCPCGDVDPLTGELCPCPTDVPTPTTGIAPPPRQPVDPAVQTAYTSLLTAKQNSQNPLDYVSPQAAIAAGLPQQAVYNAWSKAMARFPTQQAALAAGIPAGVVTQLWEISRSAAPAPTSFFDQSPLGIKNSVLLAFGAGLAGLAVLRGRRH